MHVYNGFVSAEKLQEKIVELHKLYETKKIYNIDGALEIYLIRLYEAGMILLKIVGHSRVLNDEIDIISAALIHISNILKKMEVHVFPDVREDYHNMMEGEFKEHTHKRLTMQNDGSWEWYFELYYADVRLTLFKTFEYIIEHMKPVAPMEQ